MTEVVSADIPGPVVSMQAQSVVVNTPTRTAVARQEVPRSVVTVRGIPGPAGPVGSAGGALLVTNRLNEFDDETKKAEARSNLGLQVIDGGTFF